MGPLLGATLHGAIRLHPTGAARIGIGQVHPETAIGTQDPPHGLKYIYQVRYIIIRVRFTAQFTTPGPTPLAPLPP